MIKMNNNKNRWKRVNHKRCKRQDTRENVWQKEVKRYQKIMDTVKIEQK